MVVIEQYSLLKAAHRIEVYFRKKCIYFVQHKPHVSVASYRQLQFLFLAYVDPYEIPPMQRKSMVIRCVSFHIIYYIIIYQPLYGLTGCYTVLKPVSGGAYSGSTMVTDLVSCSLSRCIHLMSGSVGIGQGCGGVMQGGD